MPTFPWNHLGSGSGVCNVTVKPPFWRHEDNRPFLCHLVDATLEMWCENIRLPHWQTTRCGHGPVYKSISTTGRLMRSCWQSCQSNAPWAALEEVVLLSASKTVQENPLTTINGSETALDRRWTGRQTQALLFGVDPPVVSFVSLCFWIGFGAEVTRSCLWRSTSNTTWDNGTVWSWSHSSTCKAV